MSSNTHKCRQFINHRWRKMISAKKYVNESIYSFQWKFQIYSHSVWIRSNFTFLRIQIERNFDRLRERVAWNSVSRYRIPFALPHTIPHAHQRHPLFLSLFHTHVHTYTLKNTHSQRHTHTHTHSLCLS